MLRKLMVGTVLLSGACVSETWVYAPTDEVTVDMAKGERFLRGEAVLSYDPTGMPPSEEEVSNALRMSVTSSAREVPHLEFLDANVGEVAEIEPGSTNLHGVYRDCGEARCEVSVPFVITRERVTEAELTVSADAILTRESVAHRTSAESDAAGLRIEVW